MASYYDAPQLGGGSSADASQLGGHPERRLAPNGRPYTKEEFMRWYGGERQWAEAEREPVAGPVRQEQDRWRVCTRCGCYEPFQDKTDECCRVEFGLACVFADPEPCSGEPHALRETQHKPAR